MTRNLYYLSLCSDERPGIIMRAEHQAVGTIGLATRGSATADSAAPIRLGIVAPRPLDPWDVAVFPALSRFGISSAIIGRAGEENPVPALGIETVRDFAPWRRIRSLELLADKIQAFAWYRRLPFPPSPLTLEDAVIGLSDRLRGFDVVMAFETYRASTYQTCQVHRSVVVKVTENIPHNPPQVPYRWLKNAVRRSSARFACVSETAREAMLVEDFPDERISIIPDGVDTDVFRPLDSSPGGDGSFCIGFAGKMDDAHGFRLLLETFARLAAEVPVRLAVAGDGPFLLGMREFAERQGLEDHVEYVGKLPYRRMPEFLASVDVLCIPCRDLPGWKPQFGVVNLEAMACGKPIVATHIGATPEIVPPGLQPYLVPPMDGRALEERLRALATDRSLAVRLGAEGRNWVQARYDIRRVAGQWASLIAEVHDAS